MKDTQQRLMVLSIILLLGVSIFFIRDVIMNLDLIKKDRPVFSDIKRDDLKEIVIQGDDFKEKIVKDGEQWYVVRDGKRFLADKMRVDGVVDSIIGLEKKELVSDNKNRHQELGVDKKNIIFKTDEKEEKIYIGDDSGRMDSFFRLGDESKVYLTDGFYGVFSSSDYRSMTVPFVEGEDEVDYIKIEGINGVLELNKKDGDWYINDEKLPDDNGDMSFYLNQLSVIQAKEILNDDPVSSQGLVPVTTITVKEGEKNKKLMVYAKDEETNYLKTDLNSLVYEISNSLGKSLNKTKEDFFEENE